MPRFRPLFEQAGATLPVRRRRGAGDLDLHAVLLVGGAAGARRAGAPRDPRGAQPGAPAALGPARFSGCRCWATSSPKSEVARFCRTLGTLLKNGVSPLAALAITQETVGNAALRRCAGRRCRQRQGGQGHWPIRWRADKVIRRRSPSSSSGSARRPRGSRRCCSRSPRSTSRRRGAASSACWPFLVPGDHDRCSASSWPLVIGSILTAVLSVYDLAI